MIKERITTLKGRPLHVRHAYDLEKPDFDKAASNARLKA
jgi:hypothetical protein